MDNGAKSIEQLIVWDGGKWPDCDKYRMPEWDEVEGN